MVVLSASKIIGGGDGGMGGSDFDKGNCLLGGGGDRPANGVIGEVSCGERLVSTASKEATAALPFLPRLLLPSIPAVSSSSPSS